MGAVSKVINGVVDAVSDVADFVTDEIIEPVVDTVSNVVENPAALAGLALSIAAPGVGTAIGSALGATGAAATAIGNAVIGGTLAEASGGDFAKGALTAGAGSLIGGVVSPEITAATGSGAAGGAITSGLLSEIQGGDFLQGAVTGGVTGAINDAKLAAAEEYLQSLPGGYEIDAAPAPTEADVLTAIGGESTPVIDTSFAPDYSLFSGNPVIPDMGAQGITAPSINEVVDLIVGVDYSIPAPETTFGLDVPSSMNIGDEASFINQPAPDSGVVIQAPTATGTNIDQTLAALDAAKAIAPIAIGALAADAITGTQDTQTGYPILPIPSDWQSPVYNMAFTPSAPVDFGSPDLLKGTQWESPMDLASLINTINNQSSVFNTAPEMLQQFNQPYTVGVNDQIGNLNGSPVSISDIIASIQSQYGQTTPSAMG